MLNSILDSRKGLTWIWNLLGPTCIVARCLLSSWLGRNGLNLCFWTMPSHGGDAERMAILICWVRNVQRMMSCSSDLLIMHVSGVRQWRNVWMEKPREIDDVLWMRLGRPCTSDGSHGPLHCQLMPLDMHQWSCMLYKIQTKRNKGLSWWSVKHHWMSTMVSSMTGWNITCRIMYINLVPTCRSGALLSNLLMLIYLCAPVPFHDALHMCNSSCTGRMWRLMSSNMMCTVLQMACKPVKVK